MPDTIHAVFINKDHNYFRGMNLNSEMKSQGYTFIIQRTNLVVKSRRLESEESQIILRLSRFRWKHMHMVHVLQSFLKGQQLVN